jgi:hypothetical protein
MVDDSANAVPESQRFPFITVGAAVGVLFAFLFLMWFVTTRENVLDTPKTDLKGEPKPDAAAKLDEVKARNEAALNGVGAKMPRDEARGKLLATLKGPNDKMPFPAPEPAVPPPPPPPKK